MGSSTGLDSLLESLSLCLDAESARRIIAFQVAAHVQEEVDRLAERANEGALDQEELSQYEALINAADFISILKRKARLHLENARVPYRGRSDATARR